MTTNIKITFSYSTDPAVLAATKQFNVYQCDPTTHTRFGTASIATIPIAQIPTAAAPATVPVGGVGKVSISVVAYDGTNEGPPAFLDTYILLPPVTNLVRE
jgi:hypothetical protein